MGDILHCALAIILIMEKTQELSLISLQKSDAVKLVLKSKMGDLGFVSYVTLTPISRSLFSFMLHESCLKNYISRVVMRCELDDVYKRAFQSIMCYLNIFVKFCG